MSYDQDNDETMNNDDLRELLAKYPLVKGSVKVVLRMGSDFYFVRSHMVSLGKEQELILTADREPFMTI